MCSDRSEGSVVVALMEEVMVLDGLARADKALISVWRSCGSWVMTVSTPSCVLVK